MKTKHSTIVHHYFLAASRSTRSTTPAPLRDRAIAASPRVATHNAHAYARSFPLLSLAGSTLRRSSATQLHQRTKTAMAITILLLIAFCSQAQEQRMTLSEVVTRALEKHPSIQATVLETSKQSALKKTAWDIPKTEVTYMRGQYNSINKQDNNLTLTQSLPFPGVFAQQYSLSKSTIAAARQKEKVMANEVAFQVRTLVNNLLYFNERKSALQQHDSLLTDLVRAATLQYTVGENTLLAKTSTETQSMEIKNQVLRNDLDLQNVQQQLQLLCQTSQPVEVSGTLKSLIAPPTTDSISIIENPTLLWSQQQLRIAQQQRKLEGMKILPDLRIGYFNQTLIGVQNINGNDQYFGSNKRFQGFMVGVALPLWFTPHTANIKAAQIAVDQSVKENEAISLALSQQYNQALQEFIKNRTSLDYYESSALKAANLLTSQSNKSFKSGELDYATLLLNLRQALGIYEGYLQALLQYNQSIITLHYLTGTISNEQ